MLVSCSFFLRMMHVSFIRKFKEIEPHMAEISKKIFRKPQVSNSKTQCFLAKSGYYVVIAFKC